MHPSLILHLCVFRFCCKNKSHQIVSDGLLKGTGTLRTSPILRSVPESSKRGLQARSPSLAFSSASCVSGRSCNTRTTDPKPLRGSPISSALQALKFLTHFIDPLPKNELRLQTNRIQTKMKNQGADTLPLTLIFGFERDGSIWTMPHTRKRTIPTALL